MTASPRAPADMRKDVDEALAAGERERGQEMAGWGYMTPDGIEAARVKAEQKLAPLPSPAATETTA